MIYLICRVCGEEGFQVELFSTVQDFSLLLEFRGIVKGMFIGIKGKSLE